MASPPAFTLALAVHKRRCGGFGDQYRTHNMAARWHQEAIAGYWIIFRSVPALAMLWI